MTTTDHKKRIEEMIKANKIFVFMKGEKDAPMCGFSALTMDILKSLNTEFETFDILQDQEMRQAIKDYTGWPTIPQIFIKGQFVGGSDILQELQDSGELAKMVM